MEENTLDLRLGLMVTVPETGNCFAVYSGEPSNHERQLLLKEKNVYSRWPVELLQRVFDVNIPSRKIVEYGPVEGAYEGENIHSWIKTADGQLFNFDHVIDLKRGFEAIKSGECVISPGIVYRPDQTSGLTKKNAI